MTKRPMNLLVAALLISATTVSAAFAAKKPLCDRESRIRALDLALVEGQTISEKGPVCLHLKNINWLRYEISFGQEVKVTDGPDPLKVAWAFKLPAIAAVKKAEAAKNGEKKASEMRAAAEDALPSNLDDLVALFGVEPADASQVVEGEFVAINNEFRDLSERAGDVRKLAKTAREEVKTLSEAVRALVGASDDILRTAGAAHLGERIDSTRDTIQKRSGTWPAKGDIEALQAGLAKLRKRLDAMPLVERGFQEWHRAFSSGEWNGERYKGLREKMDKLDEALKALLPGSQQETEYAEAEKRLEGWLPLLSSLTSAAAFERKIPLPCGIKFFKNEETTFRMTRKERQSVQTKDNKAEEKKQDLAVVSCPSHLAISSGLGITGLEERDFGFVQSLPDPAPATTEGEMPAGGEMPTQPAVINRFGFENRSSDRINPMVLLNTRFKGWRAYGLYASFGPVFDIDDRDSGITVGYVFGVSASIRDNLFLTVGRQYGRQPELAGGFSIGDAVPDGVTEPPLVKEWQNDWVFAVTYKVN